MVKTKDIVILGRPLKLQERSKAQMKGVTIGDSLAYKFYDGEFHGMSLLFAEPKGFLLPTCPAYERQRLIDKDVYFIASDKYVHLPMLLANERIRKTKQAKVLTPVAQYLLLYHLQIESIEGLAARDLQDKMPYSYASITLGITCLEDLGLCQKVADGSKRKVIHFDKTGKDLWEQAQSVLINPVEERIFCDDLLSDEHYPACGINALAHYTWLNPDPPVTKIGTKTEWVDRLSLAVSLREDADPRVEGEVERLINDIEWKD